MSGKLANAALLWALFSVLACSFPKLESQTTYGQIEGNVMDAQGGSILGAKIIVTNEAIGETYSQTSNAAGVYSFDSLVPGKYRIRVEMFGFRAVEVRGIRLQVNQTALVDLKLEVGSVTEAINVTATAPVLSQDTSDVGQVIATRQVAVLPLNGRNFMQVGIVTNGVIVNSSAENGRPRRRKIDAGRTEVSVLIAS
jgi:hypothetical protein